jgi:PAS domain S-box-containing protein
LGRLLAQVQDQRQRLINIVATVPGIVWEAWGEPDEANQRINFVSGYVETMLGYSVEEWLATPNFWLTIVHPDDKEEAARVAAEHFRTGHDGGVNRFRWLARDGRVLWVETHHVLVRDKAGNTVGMRGVTMDITARKEAEEERARLLEREREARREAEEAHAHLSTLADALDRALTEAELLNTIATAASGEGDLDRILASALNHLVQMVNFSGGSIALVEGDDLVVSAAVGPFAEGALGQRLSRGNW